MRLLASMRRILVQNHQFPMAPQLQDKESMNGKTSVMCTLTGLLMVIPQARAADHVRIGATTTLGNYGAFHGADVGTWAPGADLRISAPFTAWASIGVAAGYQHVVKIQTKDYLPDDGATDVGNLWLELSGYAPLLQDRLEVGGRLAFGLTHAFTDHLSNGSALALAAVATYWVTPWLGGTFEIGGSINFYEGAYSSSESEGLALLSAKVGMATRF
jgi:hypothetical protein